MRFPQNSRRRSGLRLTAKAARWQIAAALLFVALAALFATPAHAQNPTVTLVSNFGSVGTDGLVVGDTNASTALILAQKFTTGAFKNGYTLDSLEFKVRYKTGANITPQVSIYTEGSGGNPGSSLYELTGTLSSAGRNVTFTAPADATLQANTVYFVVFEDTNSSAPNHNYGVNTASGSVLDTRSQSGWTMGRGQQKQNAESWTFVDRLAIELKGTEASERELLSTTMTAGRIRDFVGDSHVGYSDFFDFGSLGEDTFAFGNPPVTYTIRTLRVSDSYAGSAFEITVSPDPGWDLSLLDPSENEFGAFTLEFAGETLPFTAISYAPSIHESYDERHQLAWSDDWLTENAPSLAIANAWTTLPRNGQFNVRLTAEEAPTLDTASVDGSSLVLTYDEYLNTNSVPWTRAYSVKVGSAPAAEPSTVAISGKTVTLTLATAVASGDTVTLNYTVLRTNPVQDLAGSDAGALSNLDVTNITADSTAPTLDTASVNGASLVLTYDENLDANSVPAASAYSVKVGSAPAAEPSRVAISGKTVTLTLATAAVAGDTVTLNYTVPPTNPVQDAEGNSSGALSNQDVTDITDDSTAPTLDTASVNGSSLVLTYDENLDANSVPAANDYSVMLGSSPGAEPSTVAISGKTVTLTLATAAVAVDTVTLNYTVPLTNPVQDIAGVAASRLLNQDITNVTYSDDSTLSDLVLEDASNDSQIMLVQDFLPDTTFYNTDVANDVDKITVIPTVNEGNATYVLIGADGPELTDADTHQDNFQISLLEGANTFSVYVTAEDGIAAETYTVLVTRAGALGVFETWSTTMTAGHWEVFNSAGDQYGFSRWVDSSYAPYGSMDENTFVYGTPPVTYVITALRLFVRGSGHFNADHEYLRITVYPDPGPGVFDDLTLEFNGETLPLAEASVRYFFSFSEGASYQWDEPWVDNNAPSLGRNNFLPVWESGVRGFEVRLSADHVPTLKTASVDGNSLVLTYDENLDANSVPAASAYSVKVGSAPAAEPSTVAISGKTVTLTLATAAVPGDTVTLNYFVFRTGPVQDLAGNNSGALIDLDVTNITNDSIAPTLVTASVNGSSLVLTYDENLDAVSVPAANAYSVMVGSAAGAEPSTVAISGKTVTLTLVTAAAYSDTVTLNYAVPQTNPVQDLAGSDAGALINQHVTNDLPSVTVSFGSATYDVDERDTVSVSVTLSADSERTVTIPLETTDQDGASGADYSGVPASVEFASGETEKIITFTATQDGDDDDGESVKLGFGTLPTGVTEGTPNETVVSINDDDDPAVAVSFGSATYDVDEGDTVTVTVTLSAALERRVTIPLDTTLQDRASSADYSGVPASVVFNYGETQQTFAFAATDDSEDDDDESVKLSFGGPLPDGVSAGTTHETVVSINDDDHPVLTVNFGAGAYSVEESDDTSTGEKQENEVTVTVTLSAAPEREVTIPIQRTNQGASDSDYSGVPTSVTVGATETEQTFTFTAEHDTEDDDDESVKLSFGGPLPDRVSAGTTHETVVSINDDDHPVLTVNFGAGAYSVEESDDTSTEREAGKRGDGDGHPERRARTRGDHPDPEDEPGGVGLRLLRRAHQRHGRCHGDGADLHLHC